MEVIAPEEGYVTSLNAEKIGVTSVHLGAGRIKKEDSIDKTVGIVLNKKTGDKVAKGDVIATLYTNNESTIKSAKDKFIKAVEFSDEKTICCSPVSRCAVIGFSHVIREATGGEARC